MSGIRDAASQRPQSLCASYVVHEHDPAWLHRGGRLLHLEPSVPERLRLSLSFNTMGFRFAEVLGLVQHNPLPWLPDLLLRTVAQVRASLLIHESFVPLPWPGAVSTAFPAAMYTHNPLTIVNYPELLDKQRLLPLSLVSAKVTWSREEPLDHHVLTALPGGQRLPLMAPAARDPGQVARAVAGRSWRCGSSGRACTGA